MALVPRNGASTGSSQLSYLLEPHKLVLSRIALVNLIFIPGTERSTRLDSDISEVKGKKLKKKRGFQASVQNPLTQRQDQLHGHVACAVPQDLGSEGPHVPSL